MLRPSGRVAKADGQWVNDISFPERRFVIRSRISADMRSTIRPDVIAREWGWPRTIRTSASIQLNADSHRP